VIISEEDCGTLRGLTSTALKKNEELVESLFDRILGRVTLHDIYHPNSGELIAAAGDELTEDICQKIEDSPIESVEIRSVLTCESKQGVCAKCYGRNLATGRLVQKGEAVGVIAGQSIGEPVPSLPSEPSTSVVLQVPTSHLRRASLPSTTVSSKLMNCVRFPTPRLKERPMISFWAVRPK
jgi:hypothetical protein